MKHGYITTHPSPHNKQNNEVNRINLRKNDHKQESRPGRYLEHGRTINGQYYVTLLDQFSNGMKKKRPYLNGKQILFLHGTTSLHTCHLHDSTAILDVLVFSSKNISRYTCLFNVYVCVQYILEHSWIISTINSFSTYVKYNEINELRASHMF